MILTVEQLRDLTCGVVRVEEADGYARFCRMSGAQEQYYREKSAFLHKANASANVRLAMVTDSASLEFDFRAYAGSSRNFAYFDLYVNGAMIRHCGFEGLELTSGHLCFALGEGKKTVELYFPWSWRVDVANVTLDEGCAAEPLKRSRRLLCFGDSITQGFDNLYPSQSYVSRLARMLDADEINKGVGGEKFRPELPGSDEGLAPDVITVAYGTNDWTKFTKEELAEQCSAFCRGVSAQYPQAKIFVISPIWRVDSEKTYNFGAPLSGVLEVIAECCEGLDNVTVLNGYGFVPHQKEFFRDMRVHPNDMGSAQYAEGLYAQIMATQ